MTDRMVSPADGTKGESPVERLQSALGYRFREPSLLQRALRHRSSLELEPAAESNERLEFLGDAVLGLAAVERLFRRHPDRPEGELAERKNELVSARALAAWADDIGVGAALLLNAAEERQGGRAKRSILADATEAIFGAVFLDAGFEAAREVIQGFLEHAERDLTHRLVLRGAKNRLQETLQAAGRALPEYRVRGQQGPDHEKVFEVEVLIDGIGAATASARSKQAAEQKAALRALEGLAGEDSGS